MKMGPRVLAEPELLDLAIKVHLQRVRDLPWQDFLALFGDHCAMAGSSVGGSIFPNARLFSVMESDLERI